MGNGAGQRKSTAAAADVVIQLLWQVHMHKIKKPVAFLTAVVDGKILIKKRQGKKPFWDTFSSKTN